MGRAIGQLHTEDLGRIAKPLAVVFQPEHSRTTTSAGIGADTFKNATAVMQGVGENMHFGVIPGQHFPVEPDVLHGLHGEPQQGRFDKMAARATPAQGKNFTEKRPARQEHPQAETGQHCLQILLVILREIY